MNFTHLPEFVERTWDEDVMPVLAEYIAIPNLSPAFDPDWRAAGHIARAANLMERWARRRLRDVRGAVVEVIELAQRTPLLFIDVPGNSAAPVLIYGHLDKQPPMDGWSPGKGVWAPVLEGDRLYGRGGADDGYAIFSALTAIMALREQRLDRARCVILIEACEESGSTDLPAYMEHLTPRIGSPAVVIALDANCGNYDQLWLTTSLRGQVAGTLTVQVLEAGVHSGDSSGVVPSSFRIARKLLSRVENEDTGEIIVPDFHVSIPPERRAQAAQAAAALGRDLHEQLPFAAGVRPVTDDLTDLALNRTWRPQLAITGMNGLPSVANAAAIMQPTTALKLSLRLPPTLKPEAAAERLKAILEADPPYGSQVSFTIDMASKGWNAPAIARELETSLNEASLRAFGRQCALIGGGGGIPFLALLGERFPQTQFVVTGVLGPQSNAHGPNEFLHIPTAKRITVALAHLLHELASTPARTATGQRNESEAHEIAGSPGGS